MNQTGNSITYSHFEIILSGIFHAVFGSTSEPLHKQFWCGKIEELKRLSADDAASEKQNGGANP